jgi:uncharacterized membrane protein
MRFAIAAVLVLLPAASALGQTRWKEMGVTATGNPVYVDPRSVKKVNGIVTAHIRVKFVKPVDVSPGVVWRSSQHIAMFDCAKSTVAAKETIYFADETGTKVVEKKTIAQPGFGSPIGGSMTKIALDYLCASK